MSGNKTPQPKHHRSINLIKAYSEFSDFSLVPQPRQNSPLFEIIPEEEINELMELIQIKNSQRQLSSHDQKYNIRKKILSLYNQSKNSKPQIKPLKIPFKAWEAKKKPRTLVPVLSSRKNNKSPFVCPRFTQNSKHSDTSNKSRNSHSDSLNLTPLSSKRIKYPDLNYLV